MSQRQADEDNSEQYGGNQQGYGKTYPPTTYRQPLNNHSDDRHQIHNGYDQYQGDYAYDQYLDNDAYDQYQGDHAYDQYQGDDGYNDTPDNYGYDQPQDNCGYDQSHSNYRNDYGYNQHQDKFCHGQTQAKFDYGQQEHYGYDQPQDGFGRAGEMGHGQRTQNTVMITQSVPANTICTSQQNQSNLIIHAILFGLLFFWPTGIWAIVFAISAQNAMNSGNMAEAERRNKIATHLIRVSVFLGIFFAIVITLIAKFIYV